MQCNSHESGLNMSNERMCTLQKKELERSERKGKKNRYSSLCCPQGIRALKTRKSRFEDLKKNLITSIYALWTSFAMLARKPLGMATTRNFFDNRRDKVLHAFSDQSDRCARVKCCAFQALRPDSLTTQSKVGVLAHCIICKARIGGFPFYHFR